MIHGADRIVMLALLCTAVIVTATHAIGCLIRDKRKSDDSYKIRDSLHRQAFGNISGSGQNKPDRFVKPGAADFFRNTPS